MTQVFEQLAAVTMILLEQVSAIGVHCGGLTVTVKIHVTVLLQASRAVQVTVVVPGGNVLPLGGLQVSVNGAQPPLAELL